MASTDRFMIAPLYSGLQQDLKPWLIPDDAFQNLENAYIFRGRVKKRFGSRFMRGSVQPVEGFEQLQSRLRINLGNTNASGNATGGVPGSIFKIGQMFSVGSQLFTVYQDGFDMPMLISGTATFATYDTTPITGGGYLIMGAAALAPVYFYPSDPVMGIATYEQDNTQASITYAFDTQFAYIFSSSGWSRLGTAIWTGSNRDYFWWYNYRGATSDTTYLYVSNYHFGVSTADSDLMQYWDGAAWNDFNPGFTSGTATNTILTARIIVPFKDRLVLLNVVENTGMSPGTNAIYVNRCRYSWNGDPTNAAAFYENVPGGGGFIDAPTKESIVTAQFLKDRLIVFFESSTWELVYTGNQILPFVWQQINTELGAVSTFSEIPFDKIVLGVGNTGIHSCNGSNVERIDEKIPDAVWYVNLTNEVVARVYGIRDYFTEMVYWSFPDPYQSDASGFNKKILTYNYKTGSWAFNDDSVTSFGYYYPTSAEGNTWESDPDTWQASEYTWATSTSPLVSKSQTIIMGNQEGYVLQLNNDVARNAPGLQITNMEQSLVNNVYVDIVCVNHNLQPGFPTLIPGDGDNDRSAAQGDFILIENALGVTGLSASSIYPVAFVIDENTIQIKEPNFSGTYLGGGTISRVSNVQITTKQYNFYVQEGRNSLINKVDFLVDKTTSGEITVDYSVSSSSFSQLVEGQANGSVLGSGTLDTKPYALVPLETTQDRIWHPIYPMAEGECIQLNMYFTFKQITNANIALSDFELHALTFFTQKTASRLQ